MELWVNGNYFSTLHSTACTRSPPIHRSHEDNQARMRDRPPRPQSSKPLGKFQAEQGDRRYEEIVDDDDGGHPIDPLIQDDDDDTDFGAEALAAQREMESKLSRQNPASKQRFRPTSAPIVRVRPQSARKISQERHDDEPDRSALSIAFLKQAAEKRKQRDREFAKELLREENEYKKKMTQKIEQANKMSVALGSKRTFAIAPDRDGIHMVKISEPSSSERIVSVENFLREFERLASVQIGQLHRRRSSVSTNQPGQTTSSKTAAKTSKHRVHGIRTSRIDSSLSVTDVVNELAFASNPSSRQSTSNSKRLITKATDRALVQEELKSVLASTMELTKVLQNQLHELKLKGWNFSSRTALQQASRRQSTVDCPRAPDRT